LLIVSRLEDKESEMKNEYTKLHERYTEVSLDWSVKCVIHTVIDERTQQFFALAAQCYFELTTQH